MPRHRKANTAAPGRALTGAGAEPSTSFRCAIYSRKSTEEGLTQDFNSLDAQREACESYILSQRHEGWRLLPQTYSDGGYSGGNMARPGLQALLAAIDAGGVDVVVVYKVDRLTRSLADFAKIVERFDRSGVSFVSVTQAFNTTTSMGRLTLNVLLSFAQFEREVGAERVRDKVAASRKKGMWMGGTVPLGYRVEAKKLVVEPMEAERVRTIFQLYRQLGSTPALAAELRRRNFTSAKRPGAGRLSGVPFGQGALGYLLRNRIYVGDVEHRGEVYKGEHEPVLDRDLFESVQEMRKAKANEKILRTKSRAVLTGVIFDSRGNRMSPTHSNKDNVRYRYYITRAMAEGRPKEAGEVARVSAGEIEQIVLNQLSKRLELKSIEEDQARALVERAIRRIEIFRNQIVITFVVARVSHENAASDMTVVVPWSPPAARPKCEVQLANEPASSPPTALQKQILAAIHTARGWMRELSTGTMASVEMIASREGKHPRSIRTALSFALLAPDIIERIMANDVPSHLTITDIGRGLPMMWSAQRTMMAATSSR